MRSWLVVDDGSEVLRVRVAPMQPEADFRATFFPSEQGESFWARDVARQGRTIINIDGAVILDRDKEGRLVGVDSLISSDLWRKRTFDVPNASGRGEIFLDAARGQDVFVGDDVPVEVLIRPDGILKLTIQRGDSGQRRIDLSDGCAALVANEGLVGFLVMKGPALKG